VDESPRVKEGIMLPVVPYLRAVRTLPIPKHLSRVEALPVVDLMVPCTFFSLPRLTWSDSGGLQAIKNPT
jgi:hypothetical protein